MNLKLLWDSEIVREIGIWICQSKAPEWPCGISMVPSGSRGNWYPIETDGCGQPEVTCPVQGSQQAAAQWQYWPPDTRSPNFWREARNSDFYVRTMEFSLLIFFFFNFAWDTQNTSRTWIFFFDLCVANSLSWLLVLCGLFLPHLSNMGSCCYFRCPVFWLDLTLLSPDSGDPSLVSGLAPLPGHPHMGHLSCPLLVLWDPAEDLDARVCLPILHPELITLILHGWRLLIQMSYLHKYVAFIFRAKIEHGVCTEGLIDSQVWYVLAC